MAATAAGLYLFFVAVSLLQQPGLTTYDTRAELTQRPVGFLAEAFTLWHPESSFGEFQNQAYGYLFPQGAWFVLAQAAQLPDWVSQRLWSALVLIVACEGARRVAGAIGLSAPTALLAGVVFGFSPRLLGTVSVITGESLPGAVMPWVVLPVLLALQGRLGTGRAALLSGAAVVCMGGVNAVENAGSLPLAAILVFWGVRRGLAPRRFAAQWVGAVLLASAWWVLPLLVLAGYAPPFYEYVESAANTTAIIGWSEAVRGDSHWVAYLITGDQSWWPAANDLVSKPWLILVSAVVSATGLWGLARLDHPLRRPLILSAVLGLGVLTIAHGGWEGSPVSGQARVLLDGALQIFRNVHKIDPIVRLPLALGFAHAVTLGLRALVDRSPRLEPAVPLMLMAPFALVLALGQPYLVNHARTPGWESISSPWQQAQRYLADHEDGRTTLILPGTGFAQQGWGWTLDEPLLVLGGVNRVTRSQVPLIPGQSIRFLAALDQLAATGRASPRLGDQLARAGIGHVVLRRDLLRGLTGSPHPGGSAVSAANAGLETVARFGDDLDGGPEVEVLSVGTRLPTLRTTPVDDVLTVRGAPESILAVQDSGLVSPEQATVLEGEPGWDLPAQVVTDSDQRRERAFGVSDESVSAVLGPGDPWRTQRAAHDYPTVPGARQVVARYDGLSSLTASSSQGYADNFGPVVPQAGPYAAVDGDRDTRWVTSSSTNPQDQWLRLVFDEPRPVRQVEVQPVVDDPTVVPIRTLEVRAGDQVRSVAASPSGAPSIVELDGSEVASVEVRVTSAGTRSKQARIGLREVQVDGLTPTRSLVLPGEVAPGASWVVATAPERRACIITIGVPDCDVVRIRDGEEDGGLDRTFTSTTGSRVALRGLVMARSTREAARLLEPVSRRQVGATSIYGADPKVSSRFAYDGQPTTAWVSADEDDNPTLLFRFPLRRTFTGLTVSSGATGDAPVAAVVRAGGRTREVDLTGDDTTAFAPLRGRSLEVSFVKSAGSDHVVVPEITLEGVNLTRAFLADAPTGAVCGLGPNIVVDGERVATKVSGTLADVVNGSPLRLESCTLGEQGPAPEDRGTVVRSGEHRLVAPSTAEFQVTQLAGVPTDAETEPTADARAVEVRTWGASRRTAEVAGGEESLLFLPENFNRGWVAEVDGRELEAVRVDGWQQAWVLPEGPADQAVAVEMTYRPQAVYQVLLPVGFVVSASVLLGGLGLLLVGFSRRRRDRGPTGRPWRTGRERRPGVATAVAVTLVAGLVLGPLAAVGLAGGLLSGTTRPRWTSVRAATLGAVLVVLSAVVDVLGGPDWFTSSGDAAAALGVGLVAGLALVPLVPRVPRVPRALEPVPS